MCVATIYVEHDGQMTEVMQDVIMVESGSRGLLLTNIMGEEKVLPARIKDIDFLKHSVVLQKEGAPGE